MANILHRVGIRAPLRKVYEAIATRAGVAQWWTRDTSGDEDLGSTLALRFTDNGREIGAFGMRILDLQQDRRVAWQVVDGPAEWLGTEIVFEIAQEDDFVIVLFQHTGWAEPSAFMHHCSTKWALFLMSLKSLFDTGAGQPSPDDVKISNWH